MRFQGLKKKICVLGKFKCLSLVHLDSNVSRHFTKSLTRGYEAIKSEESERLATNLNFLLQVKFRGAAEQIKKPRGFYPSRLR